MHIKVPWWQRQVSSLIGFVYETMLLAEGFAIKNAEYNSASVRVFAGSRTPS